MCTIEPLHMNHTIKDHPMKDVIILAMATLSKVLIVTLRPHLKVMFTHPLKVNEIMIMFGIGHNFQDRSSVHLNDR